MPVTGYCMTQSNPQRRVTTALLAMAMLLAQLTTPLAGFAGHSPPSMAAPESASQPEKTAGDHDHCADAVPSPAAVAPSPVQQANHFCNHCLNGACTAFGCAPVVLPFYAEFMLLRTASLPCQSMYPSPACAAELLYRPPITL
jgi:hypothetical protein